MMLTRLLAAALVAMLPAAASATCYGDHGAKTASQCADGQTWDATLQTCVASTTS